MLRNVWKKLFKHRLIKKYASENRLELRNNWWVLLTASQTTDHAVVKLIRTIWEIIESNIKCNKKYLYPTRKKSHFSKSLLQSNKQILIRCPSKWTTQNRFRKSMIPKKKLCNQCQLILNLNILRINHRKKKMHLLSNLTKKRYTNWIISMKQIRMPNKN